MLQPNQFNQAQTRYNLIDPLLVKAGWNLADRRSVGFQIPVDGYDAAPVNGITDYCLYQQEKIMRLPFTNFGLNAVEKLFSEDEVEEIMELTKRLIA